LLIAAATTRVMLAFFDPDALAVWWKAARSVTTPRPLGVYDVVFGIAHRACSCTPPRRRRSWITPQSRGASPGTRVE
jgi:uncharacterized protein YndB with AHSA1/START domain